MNIHKDAKKLDNAQRLNLRVKTTMQMSPYLTDAVERLHADTGRLEASAAELTAGVSEAFPRSRAPSARPPSRAPRGDRAPSTRNSPGANIRSETREHVAHRHSIFNQRSTNF